MFTLYHSNELDILTNLGAYLINNFPQVDENKNVIPFAKETVVVQQKKGGLFTYINQSWAKNFGVSLQVQQANLWQIVSNLVEGFIGKSYQIDITGIENLFLNILGIFDNKKLMERMKADPDFSELSKYLFADYAQNTDSLNKEALNEYLENAKVDYNSRKINIATDLSKVYDTYQVYRQDWLSSWTNQKLSEDKRYTYWLYAIVKHCTADDVAKNKNTQLTVLSEDEQHFINSNKWVAKFWNEYVKPNIDTKKLQVRKNISQETIATTNTIIGEDFLTDRTQSIKFLLNILRDEKGNGIAPNGNSLKSEIEKLIGKRIFVYGITSLPPIWYEILVYLGHYIDVHFMLTDPCQYYWGDLRNEWKVAELIKRNRNAKISRDSSLFNKETIDTSGSENNNNYYGQIEESFKSKADEFGIKANTLIDPLLLSFGKQGRDSLFLLTELMTQDVHLDYVNEVNAFVDPLKGTEDTTLTDSDTIDLQNSFLQHIKHAFFTANDAKTNQDSNDFFAVNDNKFCINEDDASLTVHASAGKTREVQDLYDHILNLFKEAKLKGEELNPRDVIVMCPKISEYAAEINAVFGSNFEFITQMPYDICDLYIADENPALNTIIKLLNLADHVPTNEEVFEIFKTDQVREHFKVSVDDLQLVKGFIIKNNIVSGLLSTDLNDDDYQNLIFNSANYPLSFENGLDRELRGSLMPKLDDDDAFVPYNTAIENKDIEVLGHFYNFVNQLTYLRAILKKILIQEKVAQASSNSVDELDNDSNEANFAELDFAMPVSIDDWHSFISEEIINKFFSFTKSDRNILKAINECFKTLNNVNEYFESSPIVTLALLKDRILATAQSTEGFSKFLRGKINFCAFVPMRSIPFKHVCLIGLNDGDFPRIDRPRSFDLLSKDFRKGDRSVRDDDRYMFMEAILAAEETLYMSYNAFDLTKGNELNPSVLVNELLDYICVNAKVISNKDGISTVIDDEDEIRNYLVIHDTLNVADDDNFKAKGMISSNGKTIFDGRKVPSFQTYWRGMDANILSKELADFKSQVVLNENSQALEQDIQTLKDFAKKQKIAQKDSYNRELPFALYLDENKQVKLSKYSLGRLELNEVGTDLSLDDLEKFFNAPYKYFIEKVIRVYANKNENFKDYETLLGQEDWNFKELRLIAEPEDFNAYLENSAQKGTIPLFSIGKNFINSHLNTNKENHEKFIEVTKDTITKNIDVEIKINFANIKINFANSLLSEFLNESVLGDAIDKEINFRIKGSTQYFNEKDKAIVCILKKNEKDQIFKNVISKLLAAFLINYKAKDTIVEKIIFLDFSGNYKNYDIYKYLPRGQEELFLCQFIELFLIGRVYPLPLEFSEFKPTVILNKKTDKLVYEDGEGCYLFKDSGYYKERALELFKYKYDKFPFLFGNGYYYTNKANFSEPIKFFKLCLNFALAFLHKL